jgi:hypothetical protein
LTFLLYKPRIFVKDLVLEIMLDDYQKPSFMTIFSSYPIFLLFTVNYSLKNAFKNKLSKLGSLYGF